MFDSKKKTLFVATTTSAKKTTTNSFINNGLGKAAKTISGNGAEKYSTTGAEFVDQFGQVTGWLKPRSYAEVSKDMSLLYSIDPELSVKFILYLRMITRKVQLPNGQTTESVQRGVGLKSEAIMRMIWLHINDEKLFWNNIQLFISVGSWKDVFVMLQTDLQFNDWKDRKLNWRQFGQLILAGLENENSSELVKKYLPNAEWQSKKAPSEHTLEKQTKVLIGKWLIGLLYPQFKSSKDVKAKGKYYKLYRKIKSSGTAHQWQQLISSGNVLNVNFDTVAGRALSLLVSSKFIANNGLTDRYTKWIESKPVAKYTGFVYELFKSYGTGSGSWNGWNFSSSNMTSYQKTTLNKQFMGLVETGLKGLNGNSGLLVVLDTSASMGSEVSGTGMSSYTIGKSLALYFSYLLKGAFEDVWMEFAKVAKLRKWQGSTPLARWDNEKSSIVGNTNFQGVVDEFIRMKRSGVPESDFPKGILAISDGEFDRLKCVGTNTELMLTKMRQAGFSKAYIDEFKFVFWDIRNGYYSKKKKANFETYGNYDNVFYKSGFDGSIISFLFGKEGADGIVTTPKNAEELFDAAMDQEVLNMVR